MSSFSCLAYQLGPVDRDSLCLRNKLQAYKCNGNLKYLLHVITWLDAPQVGLEAEIRARTNNVSIELSTVWSSASELGASTT
jgi:hypothetical protein